MKSEEKDVVYLETSKRLKLITAGDDSAVKARLASLRHGIGLEPGELPELWGMLFEDLPENMLGKRGKASCEEWAIYNALTLFALHQQGRDPQTDSMNEKGVSIGKAASKLVLAGGGSDEERERVGRRFFAIALASEIEAMSYHLRTFIPLLRAEGIGLDYAGLARDIYWYNTESGQASVRLVWGQDFYSSEKKEEE